MPRETDGMQEMTGAQGKAGGLGFWAITAKIGVRCDGEEGPHRCSDFCIYLILSCTK